MAVVLASSLAAILGTAAAASTSYTLTGFVDQPGGATAAPVPAGVTVNLVSRASGAVFSTTTTAGGQFKFTSSGTSGALGPGYWGLYVPTAASASVSGCKPYKCAVLPQQQTPTFQFFSSNVLLHPSAHPQVLSNVAVLPYNATLNGTITQNAVTVAGATVKLLAPAWGGLALATNASNATGFYNLSVPFGTWVLQATHASGSNLYTNSTLVTIASRTPPHVNPVLKAYAISGRVYSSLTHSYVTSSGNATLYDPTNGYLYATTSPPGGYYAFASYPANFAAGAQELYVIVAPVGFQTSYYTKNVSSPTPVHQSITVTPMTNASRGVFDTLVNYSTVNPVTGTGQLNVVTSVQLGNDSVVPGLPNGTVGQLWAQLGLDFDSSITFSATASLTAFKTWLASQGPFFPAAQAGATINGTTFVGPKVAQGLMNFTFSSTCAASCGLNSAATATYGWTNSYKLNGTIAKNASTYAIAFKFAHPTTSADVYNYTVDLPTGYALAAGTTAPANASLVGRGPQGTWTKFTLVSKVGPASTATATFTIVRIANLTANLTVSSTNAFFSSANIRNTTLNHYTVVLGVHENATYSASPTIYPAGQNGSQFIWHWGDGNTTTTSNQTTNYTYARTNGTVPFNGSLTVVSSSGSRNSTRFLVWVVTSTPTAAIATNASSYQNRTAGGTPFLFVNWSNTIHFNVTRTSLAAPNNLSIATFTMKAKNFTSTANFSQAKGASPFSNWSVAFGANTSSPKTSPGHGLYVNLSTVKIGGVASGVVGWGWVYNLTVTVWSVIGTSSSAALTILINDTQPPAPSLALQNAAGKAITGSSIVENAKHYAVVRLNAGGSADYGNGSITSYAWFISNPGNSSFTNISWTNTSVKPGGKLPSLKLVPKTSSYKIKLTVTDKNGNKANTTRSLAVAANTTRRPIMQANNLTGPSSLNAGTSYTYWLNVTVGGGAKAIARNITVTFYLRSPSGTGSKSYIAGTPGSVVFYGYSNSSKNATVNSTPLATGKIAQLKYGKTVRAQISWTPSKAGSYILYATASSTNQFVNNTSAGIASESISVKPNPTTQLIEYGGIAAGVIVVLAVLILYYRRRSRGPGDRSKPSAGRSGLERSAKRSDDEDDEA